MCCRSAKTKTELIDYGINIYWVVSTKHDELHFTLLQSQPNKFKMGKSFIVQNNISNLQIGMHIFQ